MDAPGRDEEDEDRIYQIIFESAHGEDAGLEDDDFSSQFLNDSGEGVQLEAEERRDEEVPLTNSGEVYILSLVDH